MGEWSITYRGEGLMEVEFVVSKLTSHRNS